MQLEDIKVLLTQFDQSTLTEFDLKESSFELYMNKNNVAVKRTEATETMRISEPDTITTEPVASTPSTEGTSAVVPTQVPVKEQPENTEVVMAPIVGVAYLKPASDKENFVNVGDFVKKGDVVCIIEAMKLMNEITTTVDGVITEILIENEAVVEYNQPLFRVAKGGDKR
ncbi:acetyl-CoA carboxylase biotin carboxyl carrier protein [Enterococcus faecalis]